MTLFKNLSGEGSLGEDNNSSPPRKDFRNSVDTGRRGSEEVSVAAGGVALRAEQVLSDLVSKSSASLSRFRLTDLSKPPRARVLSLRAGLSSLPGSEAT